MAPRNRRRDILDAAAPIFGEDGYERASIDAIASRAGVSKPTVYSHFGGKDQLFRESVADSAQQQNEASLGAILAMDLTPDGWRESLYQLGLALADCSLSPCSVFLDRMIVAEIGRDPDIFELVQTRAVRPVHEALAGRMAMLGNAGYLHIGEPGTAARQFVVLANAELPELTVLGTQRISAEDFEAAVRAGVDTFLRAYAVV
ncbi:TetR/AcrR family transcriptional regulator [Kineosporia sp. J2-2]|uniref:TetR/AcrR family transcriptional regulator n=1 Tax=Kineosporia corallincola TaxID=2835133 RepID=A0ABS5TLT1_9ACTN|nr:TetR/AcrR family transcriptional regulator [Kineosporia corallincola]MBT0771329.1 TetR/AcrR family transcriptional regulator [Kineosporia corallincola]